jgi:hypothetical protein
VEAIWEGVHAITKKISPKYQFYCGNASEMHLHTNIPLFLLGFFRPSLVENNGFFSFSLGKKPEVQ